MVMVVRAQPAAMPKWEVGLRAGPYIYQGDLAPSVFGSFKEIDAGFSLAASRILDRSLALRTSLTVAGLRGDDRKYNNEAWRQARALLFNTSVVELAETVVWDILGNNDNRARTRFSPYLLAGLGYSFLRVNRDASRFDSSYFSGHPVILDGLRADLARNTPRGVLVLPVGVGVRYTLAPAWSVNLEADYRFSETDYLDGFSKVGNDGRNDHYYSISVGLIYTFLPGEGIKCPTLKQ
jgi:hypothetical protein